MSAILGNGYISAFPESLIERVERQERVWAPWYTLHKIFAGLIDMASLCGDNIALKIVAQFADWAKGRMDRLSDEQMQGMLANEHGGMNETLANLYGLTGNEDYLDLARRFNHEAVQGPLSRREDCLTGLHANTQIPKAIGAAAQYKYNGDETCLTAAKFFWKIVTSHRSYVTGGNSDGERFSPKEKLSQFLSPDTTETCNTYNMLKLTRRLFIIEPDARFADYYERALYNHILASQNPETGMTCYFVPLRAGSHKTYSDEDNSFWCCTGTGIENHVVHNNSIYFHDGAKRLYVNLFIPSELVWTDTDVTLEQKTLFPNSEISHLKISCDVPVTFELAVRRPSWCDFGYQLLINGEYVSLDSNINPPGSFSIIDREWSNGDTVDIVLPMSLHTEGFADNPMRRALLCGPIVLAAEVPDPANPPAIVYDGAAPHNLAPLLEAIESVDGEQLTFKGSAEVFRSAGDREGVEVTFRPFYSIYDKDYSVYFDFFDPICWSAEEDVYLKEQQRLHDIEQRTVDLVHPNQEQSERDHNLQGETTYGGEFGIKAYRDARDNGYFSYDLKVLSDLPQDLVCTFWGSDFGREFGIQVEGVEVARQKLDSSHPDKFFDVIYPLSHDLLRDKERITVRFQPPLKGMAGGVFGCRVVRR